MRLKIILDNDKRHEERVGACGGARLGPEQLGLEDHGRDDSLHQALSMGFEQEGDMM